MVFSIIIILNCFFLFYLMKMSFIGRMLFFFDKYIYLNFKLFLKKHDSSIELIFLTIYALLQGMLAWFIKDVIISIFIVLFLFFLSLERICIRFKAQLQKEEYERKEKDVRSKISRLLFLSDNIIDKIKNPRK